MKKNTFKRVEDVAIPATSSIGQNGSKLQHLYLYSLNHNSHDKSDLLFLSNSIPIIEGGLVEAKGLFVTKQTLDSYSIKMSNKDDAAFNTLIISMKFPLSNVDFIKNLAFKAK